MSETEIQTAQRLGVKCGCPDCEEGKTRHKKPRPIDWWLALKELHCKLGE